MQHTDNHRQYYQLDQRKIFTNSIALTENIQSKGEEMRGGRRGLPLSFVSSGGSEEGGNNFWGTDKSVLHVRPHEVQANLHLWNC